MGACLQRQKIFTDFKISCLFYRSGISDPTVGRNLHHPLVIGSEGVSHAADLPIKNPLQILLIQPNLIVNRLIIPFGQIRMRQTMHRYFMPLIKLRQTLRIHTVDLHLFLLKESGITEKAAV